MIDYLNNTQSDRYNVFIYSQRLEYKRLPYASKTKGVIECYLNKAFSEDVSSTYESLGDAIGGKWYDRVNIVLSQVGQSVRFKQMSRRHWTGSEPLKVSFEVGFFSDIGLGADVIMERAKLIQMIAIPDVVTVGNFAGRLLPPGPAYLKAEKLKKYQEKITIYVGGRDNNTAFRVLENVIIDSVNITYEPDFDPDGYPHRISVTFGVQTSDIWTWADINSFKEIRPSSMVSLKEARATPGQVLPTS